MAGTRSIPINGMHMNVYDAGSGPAILFLHGNSSRWSHWAPQLRSFGAGHRCVAIDQRGFGATIAPVGTSLTAMADDAAALCAALGIARVVAIGLSMGGAVAELLALRHPALVSAVVAAAPTTLPVVRDGPAPAPTREGLRALLTASFSAAFRAAEPDTTAGLIADCLETDLATLGHFTVDDVADFDPARIATPTLIIGGSEDLLAPTPPLRALAAALPRGEYAEIAGSGHWLNREQPAVFDRLVVDFLARQG